ncbi:MAG TPA: MFS transporter [Polyangiaceae bacterium]|nr:MFS transporter [Polyangiaceae bacterium]
MFREIRERVSDANIYRVYAITLALGVAYGLAIAVLAVYLDQRGFGEIAIGKLAACFAAGLVCFSLPLGALIRRFSAKTTLAAALLGYAVTIGVFPLLGSFASIALVRFVDGACSVGVWVSSETILLTRARREHKAYVTSIYAIAIAVGYVLGPLAARLATALMPLGYTFEVSCVLALLTSAYTAFRLEPDPRASSDGDAHAVAGGRRSTVGELLWRIKTSCFATFSYGYFQASVVLFLPLFLMKSKGIAKEQTILIPAFFAAGMLLFSNYAGRIGDRRGHLAVMRVLGTVGLSMILAFVFLDSYFWMCAAVFVAGASLASISPVSLALQGVISPEHGRATSLYNAFYAVGILLGPLVSSQIFEARGGAAMLFHLAALWAAFVLFSIVFYKDDPAVLRLRAAAKPDAAPAEADILDG